jgi:hypothetical protein
MSARRLFSGVISTLALSCGATRVTPDTQGTRVTAGLCGRGLIVVESDYQSSNVSLLGFDGSVLSPSLVSSSAQAGGFALSLGGDAAPPFSAVAGPNVVIIDRTPKGVLHFVDVATAQLLSDLPVGTGFSANPHDYLKLSEHKAYVPRYDTNPNPGAQPSDGGGDILLVDPSVPAITGRIDLAQAMAGEPAQFTPNPSLVVQTAAGRVFTLLASFANDYQSATVSRLVELDPSSDSILSTLLLDGLKGCDALALSPDETELAVACTGGDTLSHDPSITASGLALVDISAAPALARHVPASVFGASPLGFSVAYAAPNVLIFGTLGHLDDSGAVAALDSLVRLDSTSGAFDEVLTSQSQPFTLGDVRCVPACGACFAADAERSGGSVLRFALDDAGNLGAPSEIRAEAQIGLPPRYLGAF